MNNPTKDAQYYKEQRQTENRNVKAALKNAGFTAKVGHDRGTASGWLCVTIVGQSFNGESYKRVMEIAIQASGRTYGAAEHISIDFTVPVENQVSA